MDKLMDAEGKKLKNKWLRMDAYRMLMTSSCPNAVRVRDASKVFTTRPTVTAGEE